MGANKKVKIGPDIAVAKFRFWDGKCYYIAVKDPRYKTSQVALLANKKREFSALSAKEQREFLLTDGFEAEIIMMPESQYKAIPATNDSMDFVRS